MVCVMTCALERLRTLAVLVAAMAIGGAGCVGIEGTDIGSGAGVEDEDDGNGLTLSLIHI